MLVSPVVEYPCTICSVQVAASIISFVFRVIGTIFQVVFFDCYKILNLLSVHPFEIGQFFLSPTEIVSDDLKKLLIGFRQLHAGNFFCKNRPSKVGMVKY